MNYINLTLGGKERGAKLGLLFLENAQKAENMNIQELFVELQMRSIFFAPKLIFHALNTNCQLKGETPDFTLENVYDWIEEDGVFVDVPAGWEETAMSFYVNGQGWLEPYPYLIPAFHKGEQQFNRDIRDAFQHIVDQFNRR